MCGAGGPVMTEAIKRVALCFPKPGTDAEENLLVSTRKSFLVSADVAHAIHPNYAAKHQEAHAPKLNGGTVLKTNDNQRYATNSTTGFVVRELARRARIGVQVRLSPLDWISPAPPLVSLWSPLNSVARGRARVHGACNHRVQPPRVTTACNHHVQEFMVRNDCPCGTTIGPIIAAKTGLRTVDLGVPSLSMHSIRETVGVSDIDNSFVLSSSVPHLLCSTPHPSPLCSTPTGALLLLLPLLPRARRRVQVLGP